MDLLHGDKAGNLINTPGRHFPTGSPSLYAGLTFQWAKFQISWEPCNYTGRRTHEGDGVLPLQVQDDFLGRTPMAGAISTATHHTHPTPL